MIPASVDITGGTGFKAAALRSLFFGKYTIVICALLLLPLVFVALGGNVSPLLTAASIVVFGLHMVRMFVREVLEDESRLLPANLPAAMHLSSRLIRPLFPRRSATAGMLLDSALRTSRGVFLLQELGIGESKLLSACFRRMEEEVDTEEFLEALKHDLSQDGEMRIDAPAILHAVLTQLPEGKAILQEADMSEEELHEILQWERFAHSFMLRASSLDPQYLVQAGAVGRDWVRGYTDALDNLTTDVSAMQPIAGEESVVIHRKEIDSSLAVMRRSDRKNILLLGIKGVGKRTLAVNIARAIRSQERLSHASFTRILKLETQKLLSGGDGEPDALLYRALTRAQDDGNFLLIIEDIGQFYKSASQQLKAVLQKFLEKKTMTIIGIADSADYHAFIKTDPGIDGNFEKIAIENASIEETRSVLMAHALVHRSAVRITARHIRSVLDLCTRYLSTQQGMPGTALAVMDEAISRARSAGSSVLNEDMIRDVITLRSKINVSRMDEDDRSKLINMEETMRRSIIGQDNAVKAVAGALKRARIDLTDRKRPLGTFLFLGPTGVGKTETAKVLAEQYFGSRDAIIRLDMNEYAHPDSAFGIIGSANPGSADGFLSQRVQEKPFSVILLDEIEKADRSILNLFLQVLDEGTLTDALGRKTDFRHTIIIATSNAGALFMRDLLRGDPDTDAKTLKSALLDSIIEERQFSPEFLNRFDEVVVFKPLSKESARRVAEIMVRDIIGDVQKKRGITVHLSDEALDALAESGYSAEFGAREMRRTVMERIETFLAEELLNRHVGRGEVIDITAEDILNAE